MIKVRFVRLGTFLLFGAFTYPFLMTSKPALWLSLVSLAWAISPPRRYALPRSPYRLARLLVGFGLTAALTSFLIRGVYEWTRFNWRWSAAILLSLAAVFASSRISVWADLPRKRFSTLKQIVQHETEWLKRRRKALGFAAPCIPFTNLEGVSNITGLALSGGGIRSATVCLGVLTEFLRLGLFKHFDYLSTVSGGGWSGSAITAMYAANSSKPDHEIDSGNYIYNTFRDRRNYLSKANVMRGFSVIVIGSMTSLVALAFLMYAITITAFWVSTFSMINWLTANDNWALAADEYIRERLGPMWLYEAPRAASLFELAWPVRLVPAFLLVAIGVLTAILLLKLLGKLLRNSLLSRFVEQSVIPMSRLVLFLSVIVGALQGRTLVTGAAFAFVTLMILTVFGGLKRKARALCALIAAALPWAIDRVVPEWQFVERLTSYWYYVVLQLMFLPYNLAQLLTTKAYIEVVYNGPAAPELRITELAVAGSEITNLLLFLGTGLVAWLAFFLLGYLFQRNRTGLHSFWRNQIDKAFLAPFGNGIENGPFFRLDPSSGSTEKDPEPSDSAPLHIINAVVNVPGSAQEQWRHEGIAPFEMSPCFCGGSATGWVETETYGDRLTLATAAAISAAAINTQGGEKIPRTFSWLFLLTNISLGVWLPNPGLANDPQRFKRRRSFAPLDMLRELLGTNSEEDAFVFVSDGGHGDNLGLVSLAQRGCRLIVCVDAGADPDWQFVDIKYALSRLKEGGWVIEGDYDDIDHSRSIDTTTGLSITDKPCHVFYLTSPAMKERQTIVLLKSSVTR
ncbi:MAG TPA: patatin-like phospholipase family protein, partial [Anaerolineales bacterium]|nr:patatin-like phospholipase family protein [Anaerolineales bacterium]